MRPVALAVVPAVLPRACRPTHSRPPHSRFRREAGLRHLSCLLRRPRHHSPWRPGASAQRLPSFLHPIMPNARSSINTGADNGLAPNRHQALPWPCLAAPLRQYQQARPSPARLPLCARRQPRLLRLRQVRLAASSHSSSSSHSTGSSNSTGSRSSSRAMAMAKTHDRATHGSRPTEHLR